MVELARNQNAADERGWRIKGVKVEGRKREKFLMATGRIGMLMPK